MISVLVAHRDDSEDQQRTRLWDFIRAKFEKELPEAEVCVGTDDGVPFSKTAAINDAAKQASGDVLLLTDSDTWVSPHLIIAAAAGVNANPETWWRPWKDKQKLGPEQTEAVLELGASWDGTVPPRGRLQARNIFWCAPPLVFSAEMFWDAGGMDERFRGHEHEDESFGLCLKTLHGAPLTITGEAIHLYHGPAQRRNERMWNGQDNPDANRPLLMDYRKARTPVLMRELIANREAAAHV